MVNSRDVYFKINNLKRLVETKYLSGNRVNYFAVNLNESDEHRNLKFKVFVELVKKDFEVYTEITFKDGNRPDILAFNKKTGEGYIFEIVNSESEESVKSKYCKYDINFELFFIYTNKPLEIQLTI